jgi:hypothetical protein
MSRPPDTPGRSRSGGTVQRDARDETCAQMLMVDAFEAVAAGHAGSVKNFVKHRASEAVRTMGTGDRISTGVGLAVAASVGIAGIVLSGGLAIPVLIAIGAGSYALRTALREIGNDLNRANRNWLRRYPQAVGADTREHANVLACESADAVRRAIDNYRMMKNTIIPNELKKYDDETRYATCEDAINHVKAVARFIHYGDKVRNYTLPLLDLCIFYMKQYKEMCDTWAAWEPAFRQGLVLFFSRHPLNGACSASESDLCYAPRSATSPLPLRPNVRSKSGWSLPIGSAAAPSDAIEITDLIHAMEEARQIVINGMHQLSGGEDTYNYSAEQRSINRVRSGSPAGAHMARARTQAMIDIVWQQVDRPGYFTRATRRIEHWYTRNNKTEKVAAVFGTITDIGSLFMPFLQGVTTISEVAKSAISGGASATTTLANTIGMGKLKAQGAAPLGTAMLNRDYIQTAAVNDIRGSGVTIANLMPKLCTHFRNAATCMQELQALGSTEITTCKQAFGLAAHACELIHEMNKVNAYLMPIIGMTDYLAAACHSWAGQEDDIWCAMERDVSGWIAGGAHENCRAGYTTCYGPKHHQTGGGLFSRTPVEWHLLSESTPHKSLT